jgi:ABC-type bacteriocin/lantibiotic exporter with double-glycine peptidase domain
LEIHKGQRVALAVLNGCGKTTIAKLLSGLYELTTGHVADYPATKPAC